MSHFTRIQTQIVDRQYLKQALQDWQREGRAQSASAAPQTSQKAGAIIHAAAGRNSAQIRRKYPVTRPADQRQMNDE